jgi:hypothetical protein
MTTLPFRPEPASLAKLRRTYRERLAARPDLAGALDRILEAASDDLAAVGVSFPPVHAEPPPIGVHVVKLPFDERDARKDLISLWFDRRYRKKGGGGFWRPVEHTRELPWWVDVEAPPVARWTPDTVMEVVAIARAELAARGATGALLISVPVPLESPYAHLSSVCLFVRVGNLRAGVSIDAGTVEYAIPNMVVYTLAELATVPSKKLEAIVRRTREQEAEARAAGAVL